jgi:fatty-acid desaturase
MLNLTPLSLFLFQLVAHLSVIYWLILGPSFGDVASVMFMYFLTGCLGMTVCYHRLLTHRSFKTPFWVESVFTILATLGMTGSSISWTAAHRLHHARTDRVGDPHSPSIIGYWRAQWGSMFSPIDIRRSPIISDPFHQAVHRNYLSLNLGYGTMLFLVGGIPAMLNWWLVPAAVLWNAGSLINTVCHTRWLGYKHSSRISQLDQSVNNPVLGLMLFGEGHHSNHHVDQTNPRIGRKWYEIDIGYWVVCLIRI